MLYFARKCGQRPIDEELAREATRTGLGPGLAFPQPTLIASVRSACAAFPDARRGKLTYPMADIGMAGFALFFMQGESFLAHQRALEEDRRASNCRTLFSMAAIPTDNHIRTQLDPVAPSHLQPAFDEALAVMDERGGLDAFRRLGGRVLVALDGTEYFCSQKIGCPPSSSSKRPVLALGFRFPARRDSSCGWSCLSRHRNGDSYSPLRRNPFHAVTINPASHGG